MIWFKYIHTSNCGVCYLYPSKLLISVINALLVTSKISEMRYIIVTELESPGESTCKIKGLTPKDAMNLISILSKKNFPCNNLSDFFEVDVSGDQVLNVLCGLDFNVVSQSMAIETTAIGGRNAKVQKIVWTMVKNKT